MTFIFCSTTKIQIVLIYCASIMVAMGGIKIIINRKTTKINDQDQKGFITINQDNIPRDLPHKGGRKNLPLPDVPMALRLRPFS
jgi:hypothetical protein